MVDANGHYLLPQYRPVYFLLLPQYRPVYFLVRVPVKWHEPVRQGQPRRTGPIKKSQYAQQ